MYIKTYKIYQQYFFDLIEYKQNFKFILKNVIKNVKDVCRVM